jgi:hypothetical protein
MKRWREINLERDRVVFCRRKMERRIVLATDPHVFHSIRVNVGNSVKDLK